MVWPVTMHYTRTDKDNSSEVTLTAFDYGANRDTNNNPNVESKRVILRRFYKSPADALAALIKPNNKLSGALWDCYCSGYEISDITIYVNDDYVSLDNNYCDDQGVNLVFTKEQIAELTELFDASNHN